MIPWYQLCLAACAALALEACVPVHAAHNDNDPDWAHIDYVAYDCAKNPAQRGCHADPDDHINDVSKGRGKGK